MKPFVLLFALFAASNTFAQGSAPAAISSPAASPVSASGAYWFTILLVTLFLAVGFSTMRTALKGWNLKDALSEEAAMPEGTPPDKLLGEDGRPHMVSSSSRLISFMGSLVLVALLTGFGYYMIWAYFSGQSIPDFKNVTDYLMAGAGIFIPYAVNKVGSAIGGK